MTKTKTARDKFDEAFWNDDAIPVVREEPSENRVYDLEGRTAQFGEAMSRMTKHEGMTKSEVACDDFDDAFWDAPAESIVREEPRNKRVYDLEERTAKFGEMVIDFAKTIPQSPVTSRIISQLVGAATSVGANDVEADDAVSKKEFLKSIGTCKKETRETKHFLRMAVRAVPALKPEARKLWMEARELHLIFSKIWRSGQEMTKH